MSWPVVLALGATTIAQLVIAWLLLRSRNAWPPLPAWTWKEIRQMIALSATIAGAAVLTVMAWWLIDLLHEQLRRDLSSPVASTLADGLVWGLKLLLGGVLLVILSLGLVIGPRVMKLRGPGNVESEFGGGEQ